MGYTRWLKVLLVSAYLRHALSAQDDPVQLGEACKLIFPLGDSNQAHPLADKRNSEVTKLVQRMYVNVNAIDIPSEETVLIDGLGNWTAVGTNWSRNKDAKACQPSTYGDSRALYEFAFGKEWLALSSKDVYFDLGGGVGKAVVTASLKYDLVRSVSVELSAARFKGSCAALSALKATMQSGNDCTGVCRRRTSIPGAIEMIYEDFLSVDLSSATVLTISPVCYQFLLPPLHQKLLRELQVGARIFVRDYSRVKNVNEAETIFNSSAITHGKKLILKGAVGQRDNRDLLSDIGSVFVVALASSHDLEL